MAREKLGKVPTTIGLPPDIIEAVKVEAARAGVPWTSMVVILVRQALDARVAS
jgi:hypothetical protein